MRPGNPYFDYVELYCQSSHCLVNYYCTTPLILNIISQTASQEALVSLEIFREVDRFSVNINFLSNFSDNLEKKVN